jgi:hypothetical protein
MPQKYISPAPVYFDSNVRGGSFKHILFIYVNLSRKKLIVAISQENISE